MEVTARGDNEEAHVLLALYTVAVTNHKLGVALLLRMAS
jgi:hypothetical protein